MPASAEKLRRQRAFARISWSATFGALLGWFVGSVLRIRRAHVERCMHHAYIYRAADFFRSLGQTVIEILTKRVDLVDIDPACIRACSQGAVIAATHTGNFELSGWAAAREVRLLAIAKVQSVGIVDRLLRRWRHAHGMMTHPPRGAMRAAREHLRSGGSVIMPIDQAPDRKRHAVLVPFLDRDAHVDRAPFVLAKRMRVPVVVIASHRTEHGRQRVELLETIDASNVSRAASRATRALDRFVREHPTEWLWMHRRWKTPP